MGVDRKALERRVRDALRSLEPGLRHRMGESKVGQFSQHEAALRRDLGLWVTFAVIQRWLEANRLIDRITLGDLPHAVPCLDALYSSASAWPDADAERILAIALEPFDFEDSALDTSVLGDCYQYHSESSRKQFALVQTPGFVADFLLLRTLEPAIAALPIAEVSLIDPSCGTGHFLVPAFHRIASEWARLHPDWPLLRSGIYALAAVAGVDINPAVVAIARLRLRIALAHFAGIKRLKNLPENLPLRVAHGDALLHGGRGFQRAEPPSERLEKERCDEQRSLWEVLG